MNSISQSEGSSQLIEEQFAGALFQEEKQSGDTPNSKGEQHMITVTSIEEHSIASSSPGEVPSNHTALLNPQAPTLTTIATELRLQIYKHLFQNPDMHLLRRRVGIDDDKVIQKLAQTFDNSILSTCQKIYQEALPLFYTSQTFHYPLTTGGLSKIHIPDPKIPWARDAPLREGAMPPFSDKLRLMINLSMDLEIIDSDFGNTDVVLFKQITGFAQRCPQLRSLTIHLISEWYVSFPVDSATVSVLRQLRPCLDKLNILVLGSRPHEVLPELRLSIADNKYWSDRCWSGQRLSGFNTFKLQWPYLTLPSLIQDHVSRETSKSYKFIGPRSDDDHIYKWICQKEVAEDVGLDSLSLSS